LHFFKDLLMNECIEMNVMNMKIVKE